MGCIVLVISYCMKSSMLIWVDSDCLAPIGVHKTQFIQLGSNLVEGPSLKHLRNALQEEIVWKGRQDGPHTNKNLGLPMHSHGNFIVDIV